MKWPQMLAIRSGAFQVIAGFMIALDFGARFFAFLLIFFVAVATFIFITSGVRRSRPERDCRRAEELVADGALFIIAGFGKGPRSVE